VDWLNYHHLFYFSVIAEEGGLAKAARKLNLTHSTLSAQLRLLEEHFEAPLFERRGKRLVLTPFGADAASYAADIFRLGRELNDVARGRVSPGREVLQIGVVAGLPKTLVHRLLAPALAEIGMGSVVVRQDALPELVDALTAGKLHLVLAQEPPTTSPAANVHAHALGETDILLYGRAMLARKGKASWPQSLAGVPFVMPSSGSPLRKRLDAWLAELDLRVEIRAEVDDAGILRAFGSAGLGIFPVRAALKSEVEDLRDVTFVGACEGVRERFYAITTERRIRHPAIAALVTSAREQLLLPAEKAVPRAKRHKRR
jgi:LysR family transcriptional activator of nhaA